MRLPEARKLANPRAPQSTWSSTASMVSRASAIWLATVRFQINS